MKKLNWSCWSSFNGRYSSRLPCQQQKLLTVSKIISVYPCSCEFSRSAIILCSFGDNRDLILLFFVKMSILRFMISNMFGGHLGGHLEFLKMLNDASRAYSRISHNLVFFKQLTPVLHETWSWVWNSKFQNWYKTSLNVYMTTTTICVKKTDNLSYMLT